MVRTVGGAAGTVHDALASSFVTHFGPLRTVGGALYFTAHYGNGETRLIRMRPVSEGFAVMSDRKGSREVFVPYSDPHAAISAAYDSVILGGKAVRRAASLASGRRVVFGLRGMK